MAIIYPTRSWRNDEVVQNYLLNEVSYNIALLKAPPFCRLVNSTPISLEPNETWTCLSWDTELTDTDSMGDGSSRITISTPGEYEIKLRYNFGPVTSDPVWVAGTPTTVTDPSGAVSPLSDGRSGQGTSGSSYAQGDTITHNHSTDTFNHNHSVFIGNHQHTVPIQDANSVYVFTAAIAIALNSDGTWAPGQGGFLAGDCTMLSQQATPSFPSVSCRAKVRLQVDDYIEGFAARRYGPPTVTGGQPNTSNSNPLGGGSFSVRWVGV